MSVSYTRPIRRTFDDGGPLAADTGDGQLIALDASCCVNPRCDCREMDVYAWRVDSARETAPAAQIIRLAKLHIDTGIVRAPQDPPRGATDGPAALTIDEVRAALRPEVLAYLRQRWQRVKGQQRRDEWRSADWSRIEHDALVPFMEIFPSDWDVAVILNGRRYWAIDCWCLKADCTCQEIAVDFIETESAPTGMARIDVGAWAVTKADNDEAARLADRVVADPSLRRELRARRTRARGVARALPRFLESRGVRPRVSDPAERQHTATAAPKVARNALCPCGSGKKFKRCCGA
jgi:SEC-C motif-containing protein